MFSQYIHPVVFLKQFKCLVLISSS